MVKIEDNNNIKTQKIMNYDDWKTMTAEEADCNDYVEIDVEVEIYDLGKNVIDAFKDDCTNIVWMESGDGTYMTTTLRVNVPLQRNDWECACWIDGNDIDNAVYDVLGKGCEYEVINWQEV